MGGLLHAGRGFSWTSSTFLLLQWYANLLRFREIKEKERASTYSLLWLFFLQPVIVPLILYNFMSLTQQHFLQYWKHCGTLWALSSSTKRSTWQVHSAKGKMRTIATEIKYYIRSVFVLFLMKIKKIYNFSDHVP